MVGIKLHYTIKMLIKLDMQSLVCFPDVAQPGPALPVGISHWDSH